ncbi:PB1 domain-containing protein [Dioscorea alata]|uniref:PB1 domain-containing protein n=1 Tax=Dioscorea alata TaxID=55571 RepID=A0ACB7UPE6_DIOAL|nr:PB1 domain-containing protein [Dioscorea alata]
MADADSTGDTSENTVTGQSVRLMCSYGGRILPRPHDHQLRYVGGDTRIVAIPRHTSWSSFLSKLAKLSGSSPDSASLIVKYQLPNEDLDALVSLTSDEDLENMMDEYDRLLLLSSPSRPPRLRLFLFPPGTNVISSSSSAFGSLLESSTSKRDTWFLDALNGGTSPGLLPLERGRSEASSVISEVPDYLFGLDSNSDDPKPKSSDPGSPAIATSSPHYHSASSPPSVTVIPDFPPTTTKKPEPPVHPIPNPNPNPNPVYYVHDSAVPVYYVPSSVPVRPMQYGPVYGGPAYVGGPPTLASARQGLAGAFEYQGGVVYPMAGVGQVGGDVVTPPGVIGPEMRIGPASHHYTT